GPLMAAFRTSPLADDSRALATALERAFGEPPVQIRTLGGSVPMAPFVEALNVPAILVPIVNFDNNQHEENENLRVGACFKGSGILAVVRAREPGRAAAGRREPSSMSLDLNAGPGEGAGADEALLGLATSANIAC